MGSAMGSDSLYYLQLKGFAGLQRVVGSASDCKARGRK